MLFTWVREVRGVSGERGGGAGDPLRRAHLAPPPRTLVDVFRHTVEQAADRPGVDAATGLLTYAELAEAAGELAAELGAHGIGRGDLVGVRITSGTTDLYVAILGILLAGALHVDADRADLAPGDRDQPVGVRDPHPGRSVACDPGEWSAVVAAPATRTQPGDRDRSGRLEQQRLRDRALSGCGAQLTTRLRSGGRAGAARRAAGRHR